MARNQQKEIELFLKQYGIYIVALIIFIFFGGRWGELVWDKARTVGVLIAVGWALAETTWGHWKYKTPQFIANNYSGSTIEKPEKIGDWVIFAIGAVRYAGIYWHGTEATVVVHKDTVKRYGEQWRSSAKVLKTDYEKLPPKIRDAIKSRNLNDYRCYFGIFPETVLKSGQKIVVKFDTKDTEVKPTEIWEAMLRVNEENFMLKELLEGRHKIILDSAGFGKQIHDISKPRNIFTSWTDPKPDQDD